MRQDRNLWPRGKAFDGFIVWFLAVVAAAHAALTFAVPNMNQKFQLGDRAWDRSAKLADILSAQDLDAVLAALHYHSAPGDYLFLLPAYAAFGPVGVIAQNIVLLLVGIWFLYRMAMAWFSPAAAKIAVVAYALLPATIFHPQVFVTEALCNPLLVVATWYAGRMLLADTPARRDVVLFGLVSAVLIFTRYVYLLLPLMIAALLMLRAGNWRRPLRPIGLFLALSYSLVVIWSGMSSLNNGHYEVGFSFQGLGSNLFLRAERMARQGDFALDPATRQARSVSVGRFAQHALKHPVPFANSLISDAVNFVVNPGAAMVYGRYLGLFDLAEAGDQDMFKWRDIRDRDGTMAMIGHLWTVSPIGLTLNALLAGMLGILYLGSLVGVWALLCDEARPLAFRLMMVAVPAYVFVFSFAAGSVRWDHRSPLEFMLCLLFAVGACRVATRFQPHDGQSAHSMMTRRRDTVPS